MNVIQTQHKQKGFTIIEVVLVLAIAALIFAMVFLALPALQRGQRDTQRRQDMSRIITALTNYSSNNRGAIPQGTDGANGWPSFVSGYLAVDGDTFTDPSGNDYQLTQGPIPSSLPTFDSATPKIYYTPGAICNGQDVTQGEGARKVAFQMLLEGGGVDCVNN